MVRSGELVVIQRGIKFKVVLPDGPSRGCTSVDLTSNESINLSTDIQEIYGEHFVLPELGPLGAHGLANARDFEHPVASFDIDQNPWSSKFEAVDVCP